MPSPAFANGPSSPKTPHTEYPLRNNEWIPSPLATPYGIIYSASPRFFSSPSLSGAVVHSPGSNSSNPIADARYNVHHIGPYPGSPPVMPYQQSPHPHASQGGWGAAFPATQHIPGTYARRSSSTGSSNQPIPHMPSSPPHSNTSRDRSNSASSAGSSSDTVIAYEVYDRHDNPMRHRHIMIITQDRGAPSPSPTPEDPDAICFQHKIQGRVAGAHCETKYVEGFFVSDHRWWKRHLLETLRDWNANVNWPKHSLKDIATKSGRSWGITVHIQVRDSSGYGGSVD